jgi:hypothetical protein
MGAPEVPRAVRIGSLVLALAVVAATGMLVATIGAWVHLVAAAHLAPNDSDARATILTDKSTLALNLVEVLATGLAGLMLAVLIRRPLQWARVATFVFAVVVTAMLLCGLNTGPIDGGEVYGLYPGWFLGVNALLGIVVIGTVIAAAIILASSSATDFYRRASRLADDPQWTSFVQRNIGS